MPDDIPAAIAVVPLATFALTLFAAGHSLWNEPFGTYSRSDALLHVGSPLVAIVG